MSEMQRPRRSALYMPASNAKAVAKARTLPADIVILDLEDSVGPDAKADARAAAIAAVAEGGFGYREVAIRVNALGTPWGEEDLAAVAGSKADAVLVPKVDRPEDILAFQERLAGGAGRMQLWAMVETCAAVTNLPAIAASAANTRLSLFVMGLNDLAKEMRARMTPERTAFLPILVSAVVAARAHGLTIMDSVCNEFRDLAAFRDEAEQGVILGFDGKTLIHPDQIMPCNHAFSPTADEVAWADKVIAAFALPDHAGKGVIRVDGKMVELLHREQAERVRAITEQIARQG